MRVEMRVSDTTRIRREEVALYALIKAGTLAIEALANFERVNGTRENPLFDGNRSSMTHSMSVGKALRRYSRRSHGLVLCGKAAPGYQQSLTPLRNETIKRNLIVIVGQPNKPRLVASM